MVASGPEMAKKWERLLQKAEVVDGRGEWPHGIIARGEEVMEVLNGFTRTPEIVTVDGGCMHTATGRAFAGRHLRPWGRVKLGECTVWMLRERTGSEAEIFRSIEDLATALDASMQRRMRKACDAMGSQRFRWDVREKDFDWGQANKATAVQEAEDCVCKMAI
jgi:hypothetical protein